MRPASTDSRFALERRVVAAARASRPAVAVPVMGPPSTSQKALMSPTHGPTLTLASPPLRPMRGATALAAWAKGARTVMGPPEIGNHKSAIREADRFTQACPTATLANVIPLGRGIT